LTIGHYAYVAVSGFPNVAYRLGHQKEHEVSSTGFVPDLRWWRMEMAARLSGMLAVTGLG